MVRFLAARGYKSAEAGTMIEAIDVIRGTGRVNVFETTWLSIYCSGLHAIDAVQRRPIERRSRPGNDRMLRVVRGAGRRSWGILAGRFRRRIDPYGGRQGFWAWWSADESLRMRGVGHEAGAVPQVEDRRRAAVMHVGRREIAEAAVVVGVIVPSQEVVADGARVFECAEPLRKRRPILEGAKLRLRERIVIAHARPRVAGRDARGRRTTARRACCAWARRGRRES